MFDIYRILAQCMSGPLNTQDFDPSLPSVRRLSLRSGLRVLRSSQAVCHTRAILVCQCYRHKDNIIWLNASVNVKVYFIYIYTELYLKVCHNIVTITSCNK